MKNKPTKTDIKKDFAVAPMKCLSSGRMEEQCYSGVLRSVYAEIYLLDFKKNQARELYRSDDIFLPPSAGLTLSGLFNEALTKLVHPDDHDALLRL